MKERLEVSLTRRASFSVDPVTLVRGHAKQWEAMTEQRVASLGYPPWERFTCFLNEIVETTPGEDFEYLDGATLGWDDEDYDWRWTREQADALDSEVAPPNGPVLHCEGQTAMFMASATEAPEFWSVEDLAARYKVSPATVHQWLYKGTAPRSLKIGRYRRFRVSDVLVWEDAQADPEPRPEVRA